MKRDKISIPAQLAHLGGLWKPSPLEQNEMWIMSNQAYFDGQIINFYDNGELVGKYDYAISYPWLYQDYSKRIGV